MNTAFLYAVLEEDVHVEAAPGYEKMDKDGVPLVMKLHKSLYGLAQSPGNWFKTIDPEGVALGFVPLKSDTCVYIYRNNGVVIILSLYVDDLLLVGTDIQVIESIKQKLMKRFKMTDIGDVSLVLGMQVQSLTAMSTMEADLVAAALAIKEAVFCSNVLIELGFGKEVEKVPLYIDNTATLHVIGNRAYSSRTKHIALRFFYIRELVSEGKITIHYVSIEDNLADIGTKHLTKQRLQQLLHKFKNF